MTISRGQMRRELYGVGSLVGREKFGLGSKLKKFVRKIIPNEVAEVAVKAAPFVAPFNPLLAGGMSALGSFDQTGSIGQSVKSGLINYGLGQGARYLGGAGFQQGVNPFAGGSYGFSSPLGTETGIGKLLADKGYIGQATGPQTFDQKYASIEDVLFETAPDKLSTAQKAGIVFDKNIAQTATPGFKESVSKLFSGDFTTMGEGLKELGGKALKTIYTNKDGSIDKLAIGATIAGGANYIEAKKLAEEAGLVDDADEYTEEMYEADKQAYLDKYSSILTPEAFGLKDGGRVKYAEGSLSKNRIAQLMSLLESETIDEDYKKQIRQEIDQLMGKYKSGGRVNLKGGGKSDYWETVTRMFIEAGGEKGTGMNINDFADKYFPKMQDGGRVKLELGSTPGGIPSIKLKEKKDYNFMDLIDKEDEDEYYEKKAEELDRKYNPERYKQILPKEKPMDKYMLDEVMSEKGMNTLSEETRDEAMKMYAERAFKKGQISEDEYREIMGFKKGGRIGFKVGGNKSYADYEREERIAELESLIDRLMTEEGIQDKGYATKLAGDLIDMKNKGIDSDRLKFLNERSAIYALPTNMRPEPEYYDALKALQTRVYEKEGGRIGYKIGSKPSEDELGIMSLDIEKDGDEDEEMLMADAPGITFTRQEKSYLFRTLAGQGGSDRSFTMPQLYGILNNPNSDKNIGDAKALKAFLKMKGFATGGRVQYAMGSEVPVRKNQGGITELDYRNTGGFVPIGVKEKADDVPAMLSKNEFVFTADAVRAAGGGSVNKGAQRMYNLMKSLENKVV